MRGASGVAFECTRIEYRNAGHARTDEMRQKSSTNNLDLGKFRHRLSGQLGKCLLRCGDFGGFLARAASCAQRNPVACDRRVENARVIGTFRGDGVYGLAHGVLIAVFLQCSLVVHRDAETVGLVEERSD